MKPTTVDRVLAALKKHGACTLVELAKHANTSVATLYTLKLTTDHGVVKHQVEGQTAAVYSLDKAAPRKREGVAPKAPPNRPAAKPPTNAHAAFAINEAGELGIEKDGGKLSLDAAEFERLRGFIERTESVWKGAGA